MSHSSQSCPDGPGGAPLDRLAYAPAERAVLTIARHYFASFAAPPSQGWVSAIATGLAQFGEVRGAGIAVAVLGVVQTMRRSRQSAFLFNAADCPGCSARVTGHERLLMSALRACLRGNPEAARAHATLLCEGNEAGALVAMLGVLGDHLGPPRRAEVAAVAAGR